MNHLFIRRVSLFLVLAALLPGTVRSQTISSPSSSGDGERLALLPFEIRGLTAPDGLQLKQKFGETLAESKRFDIMPDNVLRNNLDLAGIGRIDSCNTLPCLAQVGKVLNVEKVVHVSVDQRRERFVMHVRLVRSHDGALLYAERIDFAGTFDDLFSTVVPEQARRLGAAYLDRKANWYLVAVAIILGVALIYWRYSTLTSMSSADAELPGSAPSPQ